MKTARAIKPLMNAPREFGITRTLREFNLMRVNLHQLVEKGLRKQIRSIFRKDAEPREGKNGLARDQDRGGVEYEQPT
jgi:hypothetical protein